MLFQYKRFTGSCIRVRNDVSQHHARLPRDHARLPRVIMAYLRIKFFIRQKTAIFLSERRLPQANAPH